MSLSTISRSVTKVFMSALAVAALFLSFGVLTTNAQGTMDRRVKSKVSPLYPEIARKMALGGVVKLEVRVAANGTVKDTKVIGGNPILVNAAVDAVKKWKFEPGNEESVGVIEFNFDPSMN